MVVTTRARTGIAGTTPVGMMLSRSNRPHVPTTRIITVKRTTKDTALIATITTTYEHKQLKAELRKYHLSSENPSRLLTLLNNMKHYRYDPKKIVAEFSSIISLKRRELYKGYMFLR